jgi:hypothetical protein
MHKLLKNIGIKFTTCSTALFMEFSYNDCKQNCNNKKSYSNWTIQKWNETLQNVKHIRSTGMYSLREG